MKNIRGLYYYSIINRINIIIFLVASILMILIFSLYSFDNIDYIYNIEAVNSDYLKRNLSILLFVDALFISVIIALDHIFNSGKFDVLFVHELNKHDFIKIRIRIYLTIFYSISTILYLIMIIIGMIKLKYFLFDFNIIKIYLLYMIVISIMIMYSYLFSELFIAMGSILSIFLYLIATILNNFSRLLSNIVMVNIDIDYINIYQFIYGILIIILLYIILLRAFNQKDWKNY